MSIWIYICQVLQWVLPDEHTMAFQHPLLEEKMFNQHYPQLCDTLTDVDNLLPYFVRESVITTNDVEEINAKETKKLKVQKLMTHISGPLRAGNTEVFYIMLKIMEENGHLSTKQLADQIRKSISVCK